MSGRVREDLEPDHTDRARPATRLTSSLHIDQARLCLDGNIAAKALSATGMLNGRPDQGNNTHRLLLIGAVHERSRWP